MFSFRRENYQPTASIVEDGANVLKWGDGAGRLLAEKDKNKYNAFKTVTRNCSGEKSGGGSN